MSALQLSEDFKKFRRSVLTESATDPYYFACAAFDWGVGELKNFKGVQDWQRDILMDIRDGLLTPGDAIQIAVASGHGIGKANRNDCIVPAPEGSRTWGNNKVGDYLLDENGQPVKIVARKDFKTEYFKVSFDDGSSTVVSSGHLWNVRGRKERRNGIEGWRTVSTQELMDLGVTRPNGTARARQWEIPKTKPVEFDPRPVAVDPYVMGLWLGDGSKNKPAITTIDQEVIGQIESKYSISRGVKQGTEALSIRVLGEIENFRKYPEFGLSSFEKKVPDDFKYNSATARAEVLRGLLDTDAECNQAGSIVYTSTSKALADDVIWLARSLGGKASLQDSVKNPYYRKDDEKVFCRPAYSVTVQMPNDFRCFYIERKQSRRKAVEDRYLTRWISSIESVGVSEGHCVTVDSETGLYLCDDFIVTHNSALVSIIILWALFTRVDTKGVVTANTENQLKTKTWAEVAKWFRLCRLNHGFKMTKTALFSTNPEHEQTWRIDMVPWSENNTEAFAGMHNEGRRILLIMDEASAIPDKIFEVAEGALTDETAEILWICFGNPTKNSGRFWKCFNGLKHRWNQRQIDSRQSVITNKRQIEKWIEDYGEDSDFVRVRVKGTFPRSGSMQLISSEDIRMARERSYNQDVFMMMPIIIGVDVARFGDDQTVISIRQGRKQHFMFKYRGLNTQQVASIVVQCIDKYHPSAVFIDEGAMGAGVIDRCVALGYDVIPVAFGGRAADDVKYFNKRAEMFGRCADWFAAGADIVDDEELDNELSSIEYDFNEKEQIKLPKKSEMKKKGFASPDCADSLAITFAEHVLISNSRGGFEPDE